MTKLLRKSASWCRLQGFPHKRCLVVVTAIPQDRLLPVSFCRDWCWTVTVGVSCASAHVRHEGKRLPLRSPCSPFGYDPAQQSIKSFRDVAHDLHSRRFSYLASSTVVAHSRWGYHPMCCKLITNVGNSEQQYEKQESAALTRKQPVAGLSRKRPFERDKTSFHGSSTFSSDNM